MDFLDDGRSSRLTYAAGLTTAINWKYVAFANDESITVQPLDNPELIGHLYREIGQAKVTRVLLFSSIRISRLYFSSGSQVFVHDVEAQNLDIAIHGNGRTVTALACSYHDPDLLAVGTVDGSVTIWDLGAGAKLQHRLNTADRAACQHIAFSPVDADIFAASYGGKIAIWSLRNLTKAITIIPTSFHKVHSLSWHPSRSGILLAVSGGGQVVVWDAGATLSSTYALSTNSDDEDRGAFGHLDDLDRSITPILSLEMYNAAASHAGWVGERGIIVLSDSCRKVLFFEVDHGLREAKEVTKVWFKSAALALDIRDSYGRTSVTAHELGSTHSQELAATVIQDFGWPSNGSEKPESTEKHDTSGTFPDDHKSGSFVAGHSADAPTMEPTSIAWHRMTSSSFAKTSEQLQRSRKTEKYKKQQASATSQTESRPLSRDGLVSQGMTSSLELPKPQEDDGSPMPFLSPSIPARRSPNTPSVQGTVHLSLLPESSFNSSATTAEHDSDSDDETFAAGINGSGTLMPGGVNVPLPKACGALFGPNGQLIIFGPPKPRPDSPLSEQDGEGQSQHPNDQAKLAKLFPTFGKLLSKPSDRRTSASPRIHPRMPKLTIQANSYQSGQTWQTRTSPVKAGPEPFEQGYTVDIKVYDAVPLLLSHRTTVEECRVLRDDDESGADLCRHNAQVADAVGVHDTADIWRFLAMILEDSVPLELLAKADEGGDIAVIAREASIRAEDGSVVLTMNEEESQGKLRWADHPLGAPWLVRQVLDWAEQCADIQMLAYVTAILCGTEEKVPTKSATAQQSVLTRLPSFSTNFSSELEYRSPSQTISQPIPILHSTSNPTNSSYESPTKARQNSQASSRNTSLPTTPFLDSNSSTPPLVFPAFSRQSSRLSASGSASPELPRNSFSAAAKFYAQSITDKISSYGTSPPTKRPGASPSANELSTSLPAASSWSKSVSFASNISTARDSQLSRSYTVGEDDGYDSDKTIDDTSLPHTPRSNQGEVLIRMKGSENFADDLSGGAKAPLLPRDLATKALVWRRHYAEQLRVWGLWMQAAELDKVSGLAFSADSSGTEPSHHHDGVTPTPIPGHRRPTCTICLSMIDGVQQACPACLHTTHLLCLDEYLGVLGDETFSCASGCGCECAELGFEAVKLASVKAVDTEIGKEGMLKRGSFTDPRRWRARVERESW